MNEISEINLSTQMLNIFLNEVPEESSETERIMINSLIEEALRRGLGLNQFKEEPILKSNTTLQKVCEKRNIPEKRILDLIEEINNIRRGIE